MFNPNLLEAFTEIAKERSLGKDDLIEILEAGLLAAIKNKYKTTEGFSVEINRLTGGTKIYKLKTVMQNPSDTFNEISLAEAQEDNPDVRIMEEVKVEIPFSDFGRNAIQVAKQSVLQKIRETERDRIFSNYHHRVGDIFVGVVRKVDSNGIIVDIDRTEAYFPKKELLGKHHYNKGDSIRGILLDVKGESRGSQLILSRASKDFLRKLLYYEVPEIKSGVVVIRDIARRAGERSKVSVFTMDSKIDPIGACVGVRGSRIKNITQELEGEKINFVLWNDNPIKYIINSMSPAKVLKVVERNDEGKGSYLLVVEEEQLPLAIGKGGINARLVAALIGKNIEIMTKEEYIKYDAENMLKEIKIADAENMMKKIKKALGSVGYETLWDIYQAPEDEILDIETLSERNIKSLQDTLNGYLTEFQEKSMNELENDESEFDSYLRSL